jgi:Mce-associated membrane protein
MSETEAAAEDGTTKQVRRRATRAAGPAAQDGEAATFTQLVNPVGQAKSTPAMSSLGPPPRRRANGFRVGVIAAVLGVLLFAALGWSVWDLNGQHRAVAATASREQRFVDTASQTVVNMFSYTQQNIDDSVNRFVDGTSGPLRDMLNQNNNSANLKAMFRDTNASSEAVVSGAALEKIDEISDMASVLVAVRVTVSDIDGVNKPSQAYRLRVVVHEDDNGRMTGYDLKYPDGGN